MKKRARPPMARGPSRIRFFEEVFSKETSGAARPLLLVYSPRRSPFVFDKEEG